MKNIKRNINILVMLGLIASVAIAGCIGGDKTGPTPTETPQIKIVVTNGDKRTPSTPITINMEIPPTLSSNNIADVNIMVKSISDAPNTKVDLILPEGVTLVGGQSTWNVDLKENTPVNLSTKIMLQKDKEIEISVVAKKVIDENNSWGDIDVVYIGFEDISTPGKIEK